MCCRPIYWCVQVCSSIEGHKKKRRTNSCVPGTGTRQPDLFAEKYRCIVIEKQGFISLTTAAAATSSPLQTAACVCTRSLLPSFLVLVSLHAMDKKCQGARQAHAPVQPNCSSSRYCCHATMYIASLFEFIYSSSWTRLS